MRTRSGRTLGEVETECQRLILRYGGNPERCARESEYTILQAYVSNGDNELASSWARVLITSCELRDQTHGE